MCQKLPGFPPCTEAKQRTRQGIRADYNSCLNWSKHTRSIDYFQNLEFSLHLTMPSIRTKLINHTSVRKKSTAPHFRTGQAFRFFFPLWMALPKGTLAGCCCCRWLVLLSCLVFCGCQSSGDRKKCEEVKEKDCSLCFCSLPRHCTIHFFGTDELNRKRGAET